MNDTLWSGAGMVVVGAALGIVFYGGLWLTLRRLPRARHPYLLVLSSLMLRTATVLAGIWLCSRGEPLGIVSAMAGFILIQLLSTFRASGGPVSAAKETTP